jgi:hypothetical protein
VHHGRALRDQPRDKAAHAAAPHDFLDVTEETFPPFDRPYCAIMGSLRPTGRRYRTAVLFRENL